ncbi:hypothetical protein TWF506_010690 [Arthrobotrys conoides]|uniref:BTB domain-containing protein n=1 Tax=Arthrobotrys conoides TaxID=74498 RepID=A0AAN8RQ42_9PEZI
MVQGHPKCWRLCASCKKGCRCLKCGFCHSCAYPVGTICISEHSCDAYTEEVKNHKSEKKKLKAEKVDFEEKRKEYQLNATALHFKNYALEVKNNELELEKHNLKLRNDDLEAEKENLGLEKRALELRNRELESIRLRTYTDGLLIRKFLGLIDSKTVSVLVGPERKRFTIHIDIICLASGYFKDYFSTRAKDTEIETIILDTEVDNVDTFGMFVEHCYLGTYFTDSKDDSSMSHHLLLHARLYALAEKLQCPPLKNLALERATNWCYGHNMQLGGGNFSDIYPNILDAIRVIYTYTTDLNSGLRPYSTAEYGSGYRLSEFGIVDADDWEDDLEVVRDGFRILIARLAAAYLVDLRETDAFVELHHAFPDFNTDMLLFINDRPVVTAVEERKSSLVPTISPSTSQAGVQQEETVQLRRKNILEFSSLFNTETFTIFVGEDLKRFDVHIAALKCSDYFQKLTTSNMKEAKEKTVHLNSEVDSAEAFDMFVQYCYFQDYFHDEIRINVLTLALHASTYLLADRLGCIGLKELALQKANMLCDSAYANERARYKTFSAVSIAVAMIYGNTYDMHGGKISKTKGINCYNAADTTDPSDEGKGDESTTTTKEKVLEKDRDGFRVLLARFASAYLSELREFHESFIAKHHAFPDFATDVMLLATAGEKIELDEDGRPKA